MSRARRFRFRVIMKRRGVLLIRGLGSFQKKSANRNLSSDKSSDLVSEIVQKPI